MESSPSKSEDADDKKLTGKKKQKRAGAIGGFAVDAKSAPDKHSEPHESLLDTLTLTKRRAGESTAVIPLTQALEEAQAAREPEAGEIEVPLESLSQSEQQFAAQEIVAAHLQAESETVPQADETETGITPAAAVEHFREQLTGAGLSPEEAYTETLRYIEQDAESLTDDKLAETGGQPVATTPEHDQVIGEGKGYPTKTLAAGSAGGSGRPPGGPALTPGPSHNAYIPPAAPLTPQTTKEYVPYYNSGDVMGAALIGGIVGYLIGRRRGRIKTERKLKPIQKKLEQQVTDLRENIVSKEYHIKQIARQRRQEHQHMHKLETADTSNTKRIEALEANQLHGKQIAPETIGRVIVTAGEKPAASSQPSAKQPNIKPNKPIAPERVDTMSRAELLELSETVPLENTTLRQIYETHLIGEQGLRRLVGEYAAGGDVQKALRRELVEHERDFERDPILRDQAKAGASGSQTLSNLLRKAGASSEAQARDELAVLKARQTHHETQQQHRHKQRKVMDISMIAAIAVLFVLVVMLLISR